MALTCRTEFEALGTRWRILVSQDVPDSNWKSVSDSINQYLHTFEQECSRFLPDSTVSRINQGENIALCSVSQDFCIMLTLGIHLQTITRSSFSLGAGRRMVDAGYDAGYSFQPGKQAVLTPYITIDSGMVSLHNNALLDFGSLGKGMAIDRVCTLLQSAGIHQWIVDAGGDIRLSTQSAYPIILQHPIVGTRAIGTTSVRHGAYAASSPAHRHWGDGTWHHLMDNVSATPQQQVIGVFTQAKTAMLADALSTALFVSPPQFHAEIASTFQIKYVLMFADESLFCTPGFVWTPFEESSD